MSVALEKLAITFGPTATQALGTGQVDYGVRTPSTSTTTTSQALESVTMQDGATRVTWAGKAVEIRNNDTTNPLYFAFSVGAVSLTANQLSTISAGNSGCGWPIGPGQTVRWLVPANATFANWVQPTGATAASVSIRCIEGNAVLR